jgi:type IV secretory pathway VirD2 relaxase
VAGRVPMARAKDDFIEKWLRPAPKAAQPPGGRLHLPDLGKPAAARHGSARLSGGDGSPYRRRVVVIAYHYRMAGTGYSKLHSHLNYIERPEAGERAVTPTLIDGRSNAVMGHSVISAWKDDRHHFRIILAPADGHRLDMTAYTRKYMAELETALGTRLEWLAGIHEKADAAHPMNRHAHIVVRGIAGDGSDLVMRREFIVRELRRIAEDLATRHLGQMSQRELDAHLARQAERQRTGERTYNSGRRPVRGDGLGHD